MRYRHVTFCIIKAAVHAGKGTAFDQDLHRVCRPLTLLLSKGGGLQQDPRVRPLLRGRSRADPGSGAAARKRKLWFRGAGSRLGATCAEHNNYIIILTRLVVELGGLYSDGTLKTNQGFSKDILHCLTFLR